MCYEHINVPEVGVATQQFLGALRAPMAEPPLSKFIDLPLIYSGPLRTGTSAFATILCTLHATQ